MSGVNIEINCQNDAWQKDLPEIDAIIKRACINTLNMVEITDYADNIEISVLLTDNEQIQELNNEYRGKDKPTNVLSFPSQKLAAGEYEDLEGNVILGDLIFGLEIIKQEAEEQEKTLEHHLSHLVVHGTLHLIGYDHINDTDAQEMENIEIDILEEMGVDNPYQ